MATAAIEPHPDEVPDVYASICKGDCLEPVYRDGACLVFSKSERPEPGDFVGVWLHPDDVHPGELSRRVKRLVLGLWPGMTFPFTLTPKDEIEPMVVLEQLNPPKMYQLRASRILAMHKVIGEADTNDDGTACLRRR